MAKSKPRCVTVMWRHQVPLGETYSKIFDGMLRDVYPDKKIAIQRLESFVNIGDTTNGQLASVRIGINVNPNFLEPTDSLEIKHGVLVYDEHAQSGVGGSARGKTFVHAYDPPYQLDNDDNLNVDFYAFNPGAAAATFGWTLTIVYTVSD